MTSETSLLVYVADHVIKLQIYSDFHWSIPLS